MEGSSPMNTTINRYSSFFCCSLNITAPQEAQNVCKSEPLGIQHEYLFVLSILYDKDETGRGIASGINRSFSIGSLGDYRSRCNSKSAEGVVERPTEILR